MKQLYKILELISAIILLILLSIPATVFNVVTTRKVKGKFMWGFLKMFLFLIRELIEIVLDMCEIIAVILDRIGNIIVGDFIEYFITNERDTTFGQSEWTVSASIGKLLVEGKLNKRGLWLDRLLSRIFGAEHCKQAYEFHMIKQQFKSKTGIS